MYIMASQLFLHENICCGYLLEVHHQYTSNENYNILCFHEENYQYFLAETCHETDLSFDRVHTVIRSNCSDITSTLFEQNMGQKC